MKPRLVGIAFYDAMSKHIGSGVGEELASGGETKITLPTGAVTCTLAICPPQYEEHTRPLVGKFMTPKEVQKHRRMRHILKP
jgi:hypothetical protein